MPDSSAVFPGDQQQLTLAWPILSLTFKSGLLKCKCTQYKPTHQKVQYDRIYEVHQSCALIVWRGLFHC